MSQPITPWLRESDMVSQVEVYARYRTGVDIFVFTDEKSLYSTPPSARYWSLVNLSQTPPRRISSPSSKPSISHLSMRPLPRLTPRVPWRPSERRIPLGVSFCLLS